MGISRRVSEDEVMQISLRMKSARMLTGLTQESFAAQNDISLTSLKCWEMGRAVPRHEGLTNYLNAIKKHGIDVAFEWIFYGSGPGPTYVEGTQTSKRIPESDYMEQQIELFQNRVRSKGLNPIVIKVLDDSMEPSFAKGDIVGGYYIAVDKLVQQYSPTSIHKLPWLLGTDDSFILIYLLMGANREQIFYRKNNTDPIELLSSSLLGQICWHHKNII